MKKEEAFDAEGVPGGNGVGPIRVNTIISLGPL